MHDVARAASIAAGDADAADHAELVECSVEPIGEGTGAATSGVARLTGHVLVGARRLPFRMIRKGFQPVTEGRHAQAAGEQTHWAYWRREPLAYASGLVPAGPQLAAPACYGVTEDAIYLADVTGPAESVAVAAQRLGAWQAGTAIPGVAWLGGHQLAQRIAVSSLDWSAVAAPGNLPRIWDRRHGLLAALDRVPNVLCHGDFHIRNLIRGPGVTTVLDWATLGVGPLGADLAHLALSTGEEPLGAYLAGLGGRFDPGPAALGYRITLVLTGTSRVHWMLSQGMRVPTGYLELIESALDGADRSLTR